MQQDDQVESGIMTADKYRDLISWGRSKWKTLPNPKATALNTIAHMRSVIERDKESLGKSFDLVERVLSACARVLSVVPSVRVELTGSQLVCTLAGGGTFSFRVFAVSGTLYCESICDGGYSGWCEWLLPPGASTRGEGSFIVFAPDPDERVEAPPEATEELRRALVDRLNAFITEVASRIPIYENAVG